MNGNWFIERNLVVARPAVSKLFGIEFAFTLFDVKELLSKTHRIAQSHTTMAVEPLAGLEERLVGRIVQIDRMLVGEEELYIAQRIAVA